jgi:hypothetical protein
MPDVVPDPTLTPIKAPTPEVSSTAFDRIGGRKFLLSAVAMVVLLLGSYLGMDDTTKQYVMILALGGTGAIALENMFGKK